MKSHLLGIGSIDQFKLNTGIKNPTETQQYILGFLPINEQWSYTFGVVYKHFRSKGFDTWVVSRNYLNNIAYKHVDNNEDNPKTYDYASTEAENKARYEHTSRLNGYKFNYGAGINYAKYTNQTVKQVYVTEPDVVDYSTTFECL